ncbi:MAG TPA: preprotein translocase subunit YajC [Candidatus Marinimicrobia bacterium]|jgi:preprotein translocase subunit YajC|nr:preprotein translocase subunit YajC [Candidatus Neomarinimicrobiota bacterium]HOU16300.1 preprotein translocase subunit YajC [Candidatus Neomarinimicrobiota bacterium]HOV22662.1 preprotein translocase subunit YajC [Candidatus Neomarinimicrobiota bacterium]HQE94268.1 preprotein translocase subunit YajC [Candidatus Neomarinimicrobiota bacterium]HQH55067.1 preprotein translocase subunit YajC [Candidatus Neomarinimicrobiota bacterium]
MNSLLYAGATGGGSGAQPANPILSLLPFLLIILLMYFLMIRPQAKKQREKAKMLQEIQPGDEIVTIGGIYGKVEGVKDKNILIVRVAKDVKINISRSAVASKVEEKVVS